MGKRKAVQESSDEWPLQRENPARRALRGIGITRVKQLTSYTEKELLALHGVGPKAVRMLREALAGMGLGFALSGSPKVASKPIKLGEQRPATRGAK